MVRRPSAGRSSPFIGQHRKCQVASVRSAPVRSAPVKSALISLVGQVMPRRFARLGTHLQGSKISPHDNRIKQIRIVEVRRTGSHRPGTHRTTVDRQVCPERFAPDRSARVRLHCSSARSAGPHRKVYVVQVRPYSSHESDPRRTGRAASVDQAHQTESHSADPHPTGLHQPGSPCRSALRRYASDSLNFPGPHDAGSHQSNCTRQVRRTERSQVCGGQIGTREVIGQIRTG